VIPSGSQSEDDNFKLQYGVKIMKPEEDMEKSLENQLSLADNPQEAVATTLTTQRLNPLGRTSNSSFQEKLFKYPIYTFLYELLEITDFINLACSSNFFKRFIGGPSRIQHEWDEPNKLTHHLKALASLLEEKRLASQLRPTTRHLLNYPLAPSALIKNAEVSTMVPQVQSGVPAFFPGSPSNVRMLLEQRRLDSLASELNAMAPQVQSDAPASFSIPPLIRSLSPKLPPSVLHAYPRETVRRELNSGAPSSLNSRNIASSSNNG
jgi:hypothetical protein